jgi:hypothetical protein
MVRFRLPGRGLPPASKLGIVSGVYSREEGGQKKTLFCPGIPGAGKATITSIAFNRLKTSFPDDKTGRALLYCSYKRQDNQRLTIASLLGQPAVWQSIVPKSIHELYDKHRKSRPSQNEMREALYRIIKTYSRTFIIKIDCLDECKTDRILNELLSEVYKLQEISGTRLIVTFRSKTPKQRDRAKTPSQ